MAESDLDRNEAATPYKLQKAKDRGQVAKSMDVVSATVFACAIVYLAWQGDFLVRTQFALGGRLLAQAAQGDAFAAGLAQRMVTETLWLLAPFFATLAIAAVFANLAQTGPVFSFEPVKVDWQRINPATGFKRVFSMRTLFDAARTCMKFAVLGGIGWVALQAAIRHFRVLSAAPALGFLQLLIADAVSIGFKMALALGLVALIDLGFSRRDFAKKMRMSHRDIKDEHKHREGDPRIRGRLRDLRRQMLKKTQSLGRTRDSDVLIVNPTHIAVALSYVQAEMPSPKILAKGAGPMAAAMRQIAARHGIPVVRHPVLARRLYREIDADAHVPPSLYADVARVIVWVFAMRRAKGAGA